MGTDNMKIAVLSGKGGTGKTLVSVNLAAAAGQSVYIDCDVEEPNGHLFFKPEGITEEEIKIKIPFIDDKLCSGCRICVDFCKFNALGFVKNRPFVFEEVCHSCGGCLLVCPQKAVAEKERVIGRIQRGVSGKVSVNTGILNMGEASGIPIIRELMKNAETERKSLSFFDCPPGSACTVMESIQDADYCILVAEPTLFGVYNLNMVYNLVKLFCKPHGAVLNKCFDEDDLAEKFCVEKNIKILGKILFDSELGAMNSNAKIAARESDRYRDVFSSLLQAVYKEIT